MHKHDRKYEKSFTNMTMVTEKCVMIACIQYEIDALVMLVIVNEICKVITMRACQTHKEYKIVPGFQKWKIW